MLRVAMTTTRAPWGAAFRAFVRDHATGVAVETLMTASELPKEGQRPYDVLIVDDQVPLLKAVDIDRVRHHGTHVIGLWDEQAGRGRDWVVDLGVDEALSAAVSTVELLQTIRRIGPADYPEDIAVCSPPAAASGAVRSPRPPRAVLTAWTQVSGGAGSTEALVAVSERLATGGKVLVVEAAGSSMAHRLRRAPEYGLTWALEKVASGHRPLPERLTPGRDDGTRPLGRADVICGTAAPSRPPTPNPAHLGELLDQASADYDHILVEVGALAAIPAVPGGDRFYFARVVLSRAHQAVVVAAADPIGAARLVDWRSALRRDLELDTPCVAVFGRAPHRRYERAQLASLPLRIGSASFVGVRFLPEDKAVRQARWDGKLVKSGPWARAAAALAGDLAGSPLGVARRPRAGSVGGASRQRQRTAKQ